jgi:tetratricopeptide (TPR) repeat protein
VRPSILSVSLAVLAVLAVLAFSGEILGAPSRWDTVEDPSAKRIDQALTRAIQARAARDLVQEALPVAESLFALRAATILEMEGGEALSRPDVLFFLGDAFVVADHGQDERARRILRQALAADPDSPEAARAFLDIAVASSRLADFQTARAASNDALRVEWDSDTRARVLLLRAGASMALGDLVQARRDYTTVRETAADSEPHVLAEWGLATALARDGDLPDALRYARAAAETRFSDSQGNAITVLELPSVRLAPAYDVFYYRALAAMAASEQAEAVDEAKTELEWSISLWKRYLGPAREARDRYVENAESTLRSCERRLAELQKKPKASRRGSKHGS